MPINSFLYPGAKFTPAYEVDNSCKFNGSDSYMHWTDTGGSGSRVQFSISLWCKKCSNGVFNPLVLGYQDGNNFTNLQFNASDQLQWYNETGNQIKGNLITNRLFRDCSAWYHILAIFDSGNGTAGNRMRLYVNGTEETSFATDANPDQNEDSWFNYQDKKVHLGYDTGDLGWAGSALAFNGYIAQFMLVDGTVLTPSDVGEFDSDSPTIWKPIDISSTSVGTNGAFLDFADSDNLGDNEGIAGEDWTEVNLAAADQATDTPTNNFCTMLPITKSTDATFSEGNLNVAYGTESTRRSAFGTMAVANGKWYWETTITATSQTSVEINLGISSTYNPELIGNALISTDGYSVSFFPSNGYLYIGNTQDESGLGNAAVNDIFGHALDMDAGTLQFYKNGSALGSANDITTSGSNVGELYPLFTPAVSCSSGDQTFTSSYNFGSPAVSISSGNADGNGYGNFEYAPPSGFLALCTKNLGSDGG